MTPAQHFLKPTDAAAVAEFADKVRAALGSDVLDMRLFGSKATGQDAPDSDIDILVVVTESRTDVEDRILAIAFDVNLAHDVFISPSVVGRATLDDPVGRITPFLKAALAGAPVLPRAPQGTHRHRPHLRGHLFRLEARGI